MIVKPKGFPGVAFKGLNTNQCVKLAIKEWAEGSLKYITVSREVNHFKFSKIKFVLLSQLGSGKPVSESEFLLGLCFISAFPFWKFKFFIIRESLKVE